MTFDSFSTSIDDSMFNATSVGRLGNYSASTVALITGYTNFPPRFGDSDSNEVDDRINAIRTPTGRHDTNASFNHPSIDDHCRMVEFSLTAVLSSTLCLIGLVCAVLSFVGLRRDPSMSPGASFILRALACADAVLLFSWMLAMSTPALLVFFAVDQSLCAVWVVLYRVVGRSMMFCGQMTVAWLTVLVAVGRWATIRFPFRAVGPVCPMNVIRGAVAAVIVTSVVFNVPRLFREKRGIEWGIVDESNRPHYVLTKTDLAYSYSYSFVYANVLYSLANFGIPYIFLTVFSVLLLLAYHAQRRRREAILKRHQNQHDEGGTSGGGSGRHDNEHNTTLVVVAVVVTFGICNLPAKMLQLITAIVFSELNTDCTHPLYIARRLFNILELANSIGNFIVYCALRRQFRQALSVGSRLSANRTPSPRRTELMMLQRAEVSELHDGGRHVTTVLK